ncbi:LuxR C-terminal-related transcriptional regulator [Kordiimonas sp.]|uniref:LuxR C-terminal-related transcriptional regulator n=1 Tax=Kordiimonas sp. TaxID=1970157 RepID=UPI003A90C6B3
MSEEQRQQLIERIVLSKPVTVICAPPGFHKTRLAREAGQHIAKTTGLDLRWIDALEHAQNPNAAVEALLAAKPQVTVIDGNSACNGPALAQALERLAGNETNQRIILVLRQMRDLPLARLSVTIMPDIVDATALRLRQQWKSQFIKKQLRPNVRRRIHELAGDWPIALELLTRWASSTTSIPENWSDFDILRDSGLADFIVQEVLPLFSAEELAALSKASLLETPDLRFLASLDGERRDDRVLADISFRLKGVVDRDGDRITIQRALRVYLRGTLDMLDGRSPPEVLISLADHCSSEGKLGEATALARKAGRPERIRDYAESHGALGIWIAQGFSVVKDFVQNSSAEVIGSSAVLRMMECIVHMKAGRIRVAQKLFQDLAATVGPDDTRARDLEIVRVTLMVYGCSLERTGDLEMLRKMIAEQAEDPALGTFLATLSCILNSQRARFDRAFANLIDARTQAKKAASRYNLMFLNMHEAAIHLAQGELKQARTCVSEAHRRWKSEFPHDIGVETVIAALSAAVEFEAGQLTRARNSVRRSAYRMPDAEAWFDIYFAAYETMIRLNQAEHGLGATLIRVEDEAQKLRAQGLPRVADLLVAIGLCVAGENRFQGISVRTVAHWSVPEISPTMSWQEREVFTLAQAYELEQRGSTAQALHLLKAERENARELGLVRSCLRYLLAEFSLTVLVGRSRRSDAILREAILLGAQSGMRQIFSEFGSNPLADSMAALMEDTGFNEVESQFARMVFNRLRQRRTTGVSNLSARELEVLGLLQAGGSDKHLARQLNISEHGIRYHLKNIFKKLDVHDRLAAVAAGRKQGLIV